MYCANMDYGKCRRIEILPLLKNSGLFSLSSGGWHNCNDLYKISRPEGFAYPLIIATLSGAGTLRIKDKDYLLTGGTVAFVPRNVPNIYQTQKGNHWEFYWLHTSGNLSNQFLDTAAISGSFTIPSGSGFDYISSIEKIIKLCDNNAKYHTALVLSEKLSELLHALAIYLSKASGNAPRADSLSNKVIAYLEQHYSEQVKLDNVANMLFVSKSHLIRVFKKETGCTPHRYLVDYRLIRSAQMLKHNNYSIESIAEKVGFSSSSHYISNFRRLFGITPMRYHEQRDMT